MDIFSQRYGLEETYGTEDMAEAVCKTLLLKTVVE